MSKANFVVSTVGSAAYEQKCFWAFFRVAYFHCHGGFDFGSLMDNNIEDVSHAMDLQSTIPVAERHSALAIGDHIFSSVIQGSCT